MIKHPFLVFSDFTLFEGKVKSLLSKNCINFRATHREIPEAHSHSTFFPVLCPAFYAASAPVPGVESAHSRSAAFFRWYRPDHCPVPARLPLPPDRYGEYGEAFR